MLARYVAIWKLRGANTLATEQPDIMLASSSGPEVRASITADPESHFIHIDRAGAIATQLLKGLFAPEMEGSREERLAADIEAKKAARAKRIGTGVFLVFVGEKDVDSRKSVDRWDLEGFACCFDAVDKEIVRSAFRPFVDATITACSLSFERNKDRQVEKIGEVVYLDDPETGKPIYSFTLSGGTVNVWVSNPLTADEVSTAGKRVSALMADKAMRSVSLAQKSFDQKTDTLYRFITAWSALEIFVNANFKTVYEPRWFVVMESGAPMAAKPVFERFKYVMHDKYRLADKFLIVAAVLDPEMAATDAAEFRQLKRTRDDILHGLETPHQLPTEAVQKLFLKYMQLHLDRPN